MARYGIARLIASAVFSGAVSSATCAFACEGAGVIVRIEGRPQDVEIARIENGASSLVSRPRVLEVVCRNDVIKTSGDTYIVLAIDGAGTVRVSHNIPYTVPGRSGVPSVVGNAYRTIDEQVMPDMKRLPWNVRLKGAGDDFGFALPALSTGSQKLTTGKRSLLIRLVGGIAPYNVQITDVKGNLVASQSSAGHEVLLKDVTLTSGLYRITAGDATPRSLEADVTAVDASPPAEDTFSGLADPEIRAAVTSTTLARDQTATWSLEAEQLLQAAPANGLDRDKVYELMESYGAE